MTKHDDKLIGVVPVLDCGHQASAVHQVLATYDATPHVGLRTIVYDAAIERVDESGDETIELPKPRELRVSAAIVRCLMPLKLRGWEIRAMRKIMRLTLAELAKKLDERAAAETVSRWETETQPMGGYAEKMLRLFICEELQKEAPGIEYSGKMIANLRVVDPWSVNPEYEIPAIHLRLIQLKQQSSGSIIETWNPKLAA